MQNLYLVTWDLDLTQFLVEAESKEEAVREAVQTNIGLNDLTEEQEIDAQEIETYSVDEVDFQLLQGLIKREDWMTVKEKNVIVFWD